MVGVQTPMRPQGAQGVAGVRVIEHLREPFDHRVVGGTLQGPPQGVGLGLGLVLVLVLGLGQGFHGGEVGRRVDEDECM